MPTLIEKQYAQHQHKANLFPELPAFSVFTEDQSGNIQSGIHVPGIHIDPSPITELALRRGIASEHLARSAILLYQPGSQFDDKVHSAFVSHDTYLNDQDDTAVRSSVIYMKYDPNQPPSEELQAKYNTSIRHELGHLLDKARDPAYHNPERYDPAILRIRQMGTATTLLAAEQFSAFLNNEGVRAIFTIAPGTIGGAVAGVVGSTLMLSTKDSRDTARGMLYRFDRGEREARKFEKQNRHINPVSLTGSINS